MKLKVEFMGRRCGIVGVLFIIGTVTGTIAAIIGNPSWMRQTI